jgi:CheY-like chemotaxis protein
VNQLVAEKMLKRLGCEVVIAKDGYEALEKIRLYQIDLIFMDLHMPGLDGYETTKRIREEEKRTGSKRSPIIALTAKSMSSDRQVCLEANMDDYISKPHSLTDLKRVLLNFAPNRHQTSPVADSTAISPSAAGLPLLDLAEEAKSSGPSKLKLSRSPNSQSSASVPSSPVIQDTPLISLSRSYSLPNTPLLSTSPATTSPVTTRRARSPPSSSPVGIPPPSNPRLQALTISPPLSVSPPIVLPQPKSAQTSSLLTQDSPLSAQEHSQEPSPSSFATPISTSPSPAPSPITSSSPPPSGQNPPRSNTPPRTITLPRPSHLRSLSSNSTSLPYALPPRQASPTPHEPKEGTDVRTSSSKGHPTPPRTSPLIDRRVNKDDKEQKKENRKTPQRQILMVDGMRIDRNLPDGKETG